jgi:DNA (cytosine-5)-methyltransferase 1
MTALERELIVDLFAGGGGTSTGIEMALGFPPDYACNHDPIALAMHAANHPQTVHLSKDVWKLDPLKEIPAGPIGLLWMSPDCRHFSKAAGGALRNARVRDLAWVAVRWAKARRPRVIMLENVEEFLTWGPLTKAGQPNKRRMGETFRAWRRRLEALGYVVEFQKSRACAFGAPTIRERLCVIARCDGLPIVWPKPTHGPRESLPVRHGSLKPYRVAADCIDWTIPCPSIFMTPEECEAWFRATGQRVKRPLSGNTLARIAKGLKRFILDNPAPFIVPVAHIGDQRFHAVDEPLRTIKAKNHQALVMPLISYAQQGGGVRSADQPIHTITASRKDQNQLVAAFLAQHNLGVVGHTADKPLSTITSRGTQQQIVAAHLLNLKGSGPRGERRVEDPAPAICAQGQHVAAVQAFMIKYYGTNIGFPADQPFHTETTKPRFGLVMIQGAPYQIVDIGMRMLTPRERFNAQGFPADYKIDADPAGGRISAVQQGHKCGNSVSPHWAAAHVRANFEPRRFGQVAA